MGTVALEALQNEVIREVLNVRDISVLKKVKKMLLPEGGADAVAEDEVPYLTKEEILANFGQACKELKQNLEGKLEFKTAEELLDEL